MLFFVIIAAFIPSVVFGTGDNPPGVQPCSGISPPTSLRIHECEACPCHVDQGGSVTFELDFIANAASASLTLSMEVTTFGVTTPVLLSSALTNACNRLVDSTCPVEASQLLTHVVNIPVNPEYHDGVLSQYRLNIYNAAGDATVCSLVDVIID